MYSLRYEISFKYTGRKEGPQVSLFQSRSNGRFFRRSSWRSYIVPIGTSSHYSSLAASGWHSLNSGFISSLSYLTMQLALPPIFFPPSKASSCILWAYAGGKYSIIRLDSACLQSLQTRSSTEKALLLINTPLLLIFLRGAPQLAFLCCFPSGASVSSNSIRSVSLTSRFAV